MRNRNHFKILACFFLLVIIGINLPAQILSDTCIITNGFGSEFQVSQDSIIHISWSTSDQSSVYYQQFDVQGHSLTEPIIVSETSGASIRSLSLGNENIIVVWKEFTPYWVTYVVAQLLSSNGLLIGDNIRINDDNQSGEPRDVIPFSDSLFCVIWNGISTIYGQFVSGSGNCIGNTFMISDFPDSDIDYYSYSGLGDYNDNISSFISVWTDRRDSTYRIYGRVFKKDYTFTGPSFLISDKLITNDVWNPYVFWDSDTSLLVFYEDIEDYKLFCQRVNIDGQPIVSPIQISGSDEKVIFSSVAREGDRMIAIWSTDEDNRRIYARRLNSDLSFTGDEFIVTSELYSSLMGPKVALKSGYIYTIWQDYPGKIYMNVIDYDDPPVGIDDKQETVPQDFTLYQNYPNPFNASTKIKYSIPVESDVAIRVYDVLGNQVEILDSGLHNSGQYELAWNAGHLTSGIYFIEMAAGNCRLVKKCLLVK